MKRLIRLYQTLRILVLFFAIFSCSSAILGRIWPYGNDLTLAGTIVDWASIGLSGITFLFFWFYFPSNPRAFKLFEPEESEREETIAEKRRKDWYG